MTYPTELRYKGRSYKRDKRYTHIIANLKAGKKPKVSYVLVRR